MKRPTETQLLVDLIQLHGWLTEREGSDPYRIAVAISAKRLFPDATLSQGMQKTLDEIK